MSTLAPTSQAPATLTESFDGKPIVFQTGDAFVNLTVMCAAFGQLPYEFLRLPRTKDFAAALEESLRENPVVVQNGGTSPGTWAHPDLALECARWLSPAFAIWCNRTIRRILAGEVSLTPAMPRTFAESLRMLADAEEAKAALLVENATMQPKAEFFDAVTGSDDTLPMNEAAKLIGIGRNKLMEAMRKAEVFRANNTPFQRYLDAGYFKVVESKWTHPTTGENHITISTRVFQSGVAFMQRKISGQN